MATLTSVTNHFPKPKEGFITTLGSSILAGAATVPLNSTSGLTNGDVFVGLIEPGETNEQCFTGVVDTGGNQITGVKWTTGSNVAHTAGVTIVDYVTSTTVGIISKGILVEHNQDGTHSDITADSATITDLTVTNFTIDGTAGADGWTPLGQSVNTVTANGNRSYTLVVNGADTTGTTSVGQRLKLPRTVAAPTQCADLEAGSSQYFSKTSPSGISFTTTFTCSAWIKLESYQESGIIARRNASTEGWGFSVNASGQINLVGLRVASNNKSITSYQSVPLNKWVHVAATMDMAVGDTTAQKIWIDGVEVPRSYSLTGTATALVQGTTALVVGAQRSDGTAPMDGKIAQAAVFSTQLSDATIKAMANQTMTGAESGMVAGYTLSNSLNDLSANANNLTAQNSATTTNDDTPFTNPVTGTSVTAGTTNYGIIMSQTFSTNTTYVVQVPEGETLPTTGGVGTVSYSTQKTPYGFPTDMGKWRIEYLNIGRTSVVAASASSWYNAGDRITVPIGAWVLGYNGITSVTAASASYVGAVFTMSTANNTAGDVRLHSMTPTIQPASTETNGSVSGEAGVALAAQTTYYFNAQPVINNETIYFGRSGSIFYGYADNAYL